MAPRLAFVLLLLACPMPIEAAGLAPASVEQFFLAPETPAVLRWRVDSGALSGGVPYRLSDYAGREIGTGQAARPTADALQVEVRLPQGFFEIEFPSAEQRFGITASAPSTIADPFFAIDGALSWLVGNDAQREGLIRAARWIGIPMIRERLTWGGVHTAANRWDWQSGSRFEVLRQTYARHGVKVLEMAHDGPAWMGRVEKYPEDLVAAAQSWRQIASRWHSTWGAVEIWNEPDISFGADLPADQYAPLAKAIRYGMKQAGIGTPLVGGVMAHCNHAFLETATQNRLLDSVDAFSFHTYDKASNMQRLVSDYRRWLRASQRGDLPLWITECGRPWKKGPARRSVDEDRTSALDIVMKGVEARACGIARYFPFVYPYYEENNNNFGMMDRLASPQRPTGAYAQMIRALAGSTYQGDLKHEPSGLERTAPSACWSPNPGAWSCSTRAGRKGSTSVCRPCRCAIEGIDGRELPAPRNGALTVQDGLVYAWYEPAALEPHLDRHTAARDLHANAASAGGKVVGPIVLRYQFDRAHVDPSSRGYRVKTSPAGTMPLAVRAFNLSDEPRDVTLRLKFTGPTRILATATRDVHLPAGGRADAAWDVDFSATFAAVEEEKAVVTASDRGSEILDQLQVTLAGEADLAAVLRRTPRAVRLPTEQADRWTPSIAGHGQMTMDATSEASWRLKASFKKADRWVYPVFKLPDAVRLLPGGGLLLRARCAKPASVRVFLWEGDTAVGYLTPEAVIPADGQWHVARLRLSDFVLSTANAPDANQRLDLDQVRRISIGMNSVAEENSLEVSDVYVITP